MKRIIFIIFIHLTIVLQMKVEAQNRLSYSVFGNGGAVISSQNYNIYSTIAQPTAEKTNNNLYSSYVGFWYQYEEILVSLIEEDNKIPMKYELFQNYPNPFNPNTTIEYSIPKECNVILIIYDILGRELVKLVNEEQKQGKYKIVFDPFRLSSGFYFYRIQAGKYIETRKMIYLK